MISNHTHTERAARGFTLIETLLAVLILAVSLAAPLTIAAKAMSSALIAKDQTIAFFLAQDAVEYMRFVRDTNKLNDLDYLAGMGGCTGSDGCRVDSRENTIVACTGTCPVLNYNETKSWYTYDSTVSTDTIKPTIFTRKVTISSVASNTDEQSVTVTVSWKDVGSVTRSLVVYEHITDWQ